MNTLHTFWKYVILLIVTAQAGQVLAQDIDPSAVIQAVEKEFSINPQIGADSISVNYQDSVIILEGVVDNLLAKKQSAGIASMIRGVAELENRLEVRESEADENAIKKRIVAVFEETAAVNGGNISVTVVDGMVMLEGRAHSNQEKRFAGELACGIRGVQNVENKISYEAINDRDDAAAAAEIKSILRNDARVDDGQVNVEVIKGIARLTGTVGSLWEKQVAEKLAWSAGVQEVHVTGLRVSPWSRSEALRRDKYIHKPDGQLKDAIQTAFIYDPLVSPYNIEATVRQGKVVLSGIVDNLQAYHAAGRDALNIVGVWQVDNQIEVKPEEIPSDSMIREKLSEAYEWDPFLTGKNIIAGIVEGKLLLKGNVGNLFEKLHAQHIAERIAGITEIVNELSPDEFLPVCWEMLSTTPTCMPAGITERKPDAEIRRSIVEHLRWSPFIDNGGITLEVKDGVAQLKGSMETEREKKLAGINACKGGATSVKNDIEVRFGPRQTSE